MQELHWRGLQRGEENGCVHEQHGGEWKEEINSVGICWESATRLAQDRASWRNLVEASCATVALENEENVGKIIMQFLYPVASQEKLRSYVMISTYDDNVCCYYMVYLEFRI